MKIKNYHCSTCDSEGDFFNENEGKINDNIEILKGKSTKNILDDFIDNKISMSAIERALSLPQRTLTKWKNGVTNPSAAGLALLKYLRTFPWLLEVAEHNFDYNTAQKIHISSAVQKFLSSVDFDVKDFYTSGVIATSKSAFISIQRDESFPADYSIIDIDIEKQLQISTS